ncbi:MAG: hypothetical protein AAGG44_15675 [Planctomycetota bacterium]
MFAAIVLLLISQLPADVGETNRSFEFNSGPSSFLAAPNQVGDEHDARPVSSTLQKPQPPSPPGVFGIQPIYTDPWESMPTVPTGVRGNGEANDAAGSNALPRRGSSNATKTAYASQGNLPLMPAQTASYVVSAESGLIESWSPEVGANKSANSGTNLLEAKSALDVIAAAGATPPRTVATLASFATNKPPHATAAVVPKRQPSFFRNLVRRRLGSDQGIGHERVMFAPMVVETAIGTPSTSVILRADRGLSAPDRLEYIWATPGRGPDAESRVDLIDTVYRMDIGNEKLMVMTEYTMRALNPERADNTVGFGDMVIGTKATVLDGRCTKIASVFRTHLKTGPAGRGLGTGHVALEPGLLVRRQLSPLTYFHGELKYWIPIAGSPDIAGDVLKVGAAMSTVWRESDRVALLPTLELSTYTFLSGAKTDSLGLTQRVNGEFAAELYPGMRCVMGSTEFGLVELGCGTAAIFADEGWFDSRLRFEIRLAR